MDQEIRELADAIDADRFRHAREQSPMLKLLDGFTLFEEACQRMRAGIRFEFPNAAPTEVEQVLQQRIDRLREIEEWGLYHPVTENSN